MNETRRTTVGNGHGLSVMGPKHPHWREFTRQLLAAIRAGGCDSKSLTAAGRVLEAMGGVDVERSLAHFRARSAYCDCEVLFNVEERR